MELLGENVKFVLDDPILSRSSGKHGENFESGLRELRERRGTITHEVLFPMKTSHLRQWIVLSESVLRTASTIASVTIDDRILYCTQYIS